MVLPCGNFRRRWNCLPRRRVFFRKSGDAGASARRFGSAVKPRVKKMKSFRLRILAQTLPFLLIAPGLALAQNAPTRTQALGVAFATQEAEVMTRVQALRHLAMKSGKLKQVRHLTVREQGPAIVITSAEPDKVYVPVYNPTVVYGPWQDREFPPVFLPPPQGFVAETIEPGFEVSTGYSVVRPLWGWSEPDWRSNRITVNSTEYTRITRNVQVGPGNTWRHAGPVMLVAPGAVSRTTSVTTTNVPAGTVLPGRAAAVTILPQRAAAQPNLIQTQTTTTQSGQPGQTTTTQTNTSQPGATGTTTSQPGQATTTQTNTSQPGQTPSTTTGTSQPGQTPATTAQPSTSQPGQKPTPTPPP